MKKTVYAILFSVLIVILVVSMLFVALNGKASSEKATAAQYSYTVVNTYPHATNAFTEGLVYSGGFLYESTGLNGESTLRQVNLTSGIVVQEYKVPSQYFAEGITIVNDTIIQLTWLSNIGFIYNKTTLTPIGNFTYPMQGWGLTYDGKHLIMSDGSDHLYFLNPTTFQRTGEVEVHDGNQSITEINELEYINGSIYANIWTQNEIAIINPQNGQVTGWINMSGLPDENSSNANAVLNGIAYDQQNNRLFITGKDWLHMYQITLKPNS